MSTEKEYFNLLNCCVPLMLFFILSAAGTICSYQSVKCSSWQDRATATQRKNCYCSSISKTQHNSYIQGMLQYKQRHGKREEIFFNAGCWFTAGLISGSLLTSDVQGFLPPIERRMLKVVGRMWDCCMRKNFFSCFEGVCMLGV